MNKTIEFTAADHAAVHSASKILFAKYRDFVEWEDVQQELYLWLFTHYDRAERWRENHSVKHAERTLIKALRNAGERYCRAEKAEQTGYSTEDEYFYSLGMVADLLQMYFTRDWMIPPGLQLTKTTGGKPANEGGDLMTMVADVGRAYEALPPPDRDLLQEIYGGDVPPGDAIAARSIEWGITYQGAHARIRRVLGRLRAELGGPSPYGERND